MCEDPDCAVENCNGTHAEEQPLLRAPMSLTPLAFFAEQDLSVDDNSVSYRNYDAFYTPQKLSIAAQFAADSTAHTVTIRLENGLAFATLPGFTGKNGVFTFSEEALAPELRGTIQSATFTRDSAISTSIGNQSPESGTVTYVFKDTAGVTSVLLEPTVRFDMLFVLNGADTKTFENCLTVATTETPAGGTPTTIETQTLENYTITGKAGPYFYRTSQESVKYMNPGEAGSFGYYIIASVENFTNSWSLPTLAEEVSATFVVPKGLTVDPNNIISFRAGSKLNTTNTTAEIITNNSDVENTYIKITVKNIYTDRNNLFTINFTVDDDAAAGDLKIERAAPGAEVKPYGYAETNTGYHGSIAGSTVRVTTSTGDTLTVEKSAGGNGNGVGYISPENMYEGDMAVLGTYRVLNSTPTMLGLQGFKIEFPNTVNVYATRLPVGNNRVAKNVKIITTTGETIELEELTLGAEGSGLWNWVVFSMKDYPGKTGSITGSIASIEYEADEFMSGYGSSTAHGNLVQTPTAFFGTFTETRPATIDVKVSVNAGGVPESWGSEPTTLNLPVTAPSQMTFSVSAPATGKTYQAGDSVTFSSTVEGSNAVASSTCAGTSYNKGYEVYLREMDVFNIDINSIVVTQMEGNERKPITLAPEDITTGVDIQEKPFVKLTIKDARTGQFGVDGLKDLTFSVAYNATVKSNIQTASYKFNDVMFLRPIGDVVVNSNGNTSYYISKDKFNVAGAAESGKLMAAMDNRSSFTLQAAVDFSVSTASRLVMGEYDSGWVTYDDSTAATAENTTLGLNEYGTASYQVKVQNNTEIPASNYTVHVPIPKEGETFKDQTFEWSAAIKAPITVPEDAQVKVTYATSYIDSTETTAGFENWNPANAENYKTIRIESTVEMPKQTVYTFEFDLDIIETISTIEDLAGKVNLYGSIYSVSSAAITKANAVSELAAIRLDTGLIMGMVYTDKDRDGAYNTTADAPRGQVAVYAYRNGVKVEGTPVYTDVDTGIFSIPSLKVGEEVDIEIINPNGTADTLRFNNDYTASAEKFTKKVTAATSTDYNYYELVIGLGEPYTITWDDNNAAPATFNATKKYPGEEIMGSDVPTASTVPGYGAPTWYSVKNAATGGIDTSDYEPDTHKDITFYANRDAKTVTVTYNINDADGTNPANGTGKFDGTIATAPSPTPTRNGYTFDGWYAGATKWAFGTSGTKLTTANGVTDAGGAPTLVLTAKWTENTYTVTYNANTGAGTAMPNGSATFDANFTLAENTYTKTGYTFAGWATTAAGTTVEYANKYEFKPFNLTASLTLYAVWNANTYTVTYNANTGAGTAMSNGSATFDANFTLAENTYTKEGYTFAGWATTAAGTTVEYANKYEFKPFNLTASLTLYAVWNAKTVAVGYNINYAGGTNPENGEGKFDGTIATAPTVARNGYTFNGWYAGTTKWEFGAEGTTLTTEHGVTDANAAVPAITLTAKWVDKGIDVIYDPGYTGAPAISNGTGKYDGLITSAEPTPTREGYDFNGWYAGATQWSFAATLLTTANGVAGADTAAPTLTLTAQWLAKDVDITFDSNFTGGAATTGTGKYDGTVTAPSPDPTRDGYTFAGWYKDAAGTNAWAPADKLTTANGVTGANGASPAITLYAKWVEKDVDVIYDPGYTGAPAISNGAGQFDGLITSAEPAPTREGYILDGWYVGATKWNFAATLLTTANGVEDADKATPAITLTAKWVEKDIGVIYDPGYTGAPAIPNGTGKYDGLITSAEPAPTREGYTFNGWYVGATQWNFAATLLTAANGVTGAGTATPTITLTAQWLAKDVDITFDSNFTGGAATTDTGKYDGTVTAPSPDPTRDGYTFAGWYKDAAGTNAWAPADTLTTANGVTGANGASPAITLYAKWAAKTVTVTYDEGYTGAPVTTENETFDELIANVPAAPTRAGYDFDKWVINGTEWNFATDKLTQANGVEDASTAPCITLTATWKYQVTFEAAGGTPAPATITNVEPNSKIAKPADMTKEHYTFSGWYTENTFVNEWNFTTSEVTDSMTLYAKWTLNKYTVSFNSMGGNTILPLLGVGSGSTIAQPTAPTRSGYIFQGWYKESGCVNEWNFATDTVTKNTELYAKWELAVYPAVYFTVNFDSNGGRAVTPASMQAVQGLALGSLPAAPTRAGYRFTGWNTSPAGNGAAFTAATVVTGNITVYAQWEVSNTEYYTLSFNLNGATGTPPQSQSILEGELARSVANPTYDGYTFTGWNTSANGSGTTWSFGSTVMPGRNVTLYAQWEDEDGNKPGSGNGNSGTNGDSSNTTSGGAGTTSDGDGSNSAETIDDERIPLFGTGSENWAVSNVVLALLTLLLAVITLVKAMSRKDGKKFTAVNLITIAIAAISIVVFLLTQNVGLQMAIVDKWTILMGALLVVQFGVSLFGKQDTSNQDVA